MPEPAKSYDTVNKNGLALAFSSPGVETTGSSRVDDTILLRRAQQGDTTAFEELIRHYDRTVLRLALHLTGSWQDAQDIYQETFLRAYRNLGAFRFECSFYTWIYRIVTNLCVDHLRSRVRNRKVIGEPTGEVDEQRVLDRVPDQRPNASPERAVTNRELRERIVKALGKLTARERVVFELKHFDGLKLQTVAEILRTTENTIKNTLFRATHKLRVELAEVR